MENKEEIRITPRVPIVLLAGSAASLLGVAGLSKLVEDEFSHELRTLDARINDMSGDVESKNLRNVLKVVGTSAEPWVLYAVTSLAALACIAQKRAPDSATLALALGGSAGITKALKLFVHRPRPLVKLPLVRQRFSGTSFPSNHALMSLTTYGTLTYLVVRRRPNLKWYQAARLWLVALTLCALIGWSRVLLGVHNPSDVLGGWLAGSIWMGACIIALNSVEPTPRKT